MIIIQLAGGLGNQMFQYALALQLKHLGREVKIDDVTGFKEDEKRDPALEAFGIRYERPDRGEMIRMLDSSMLPWSRVRRKLFGRRKKSYFEEDKRYHPEIMTWDDIYLEGYWQTEKYFAPVAEQVRQTYDTEKLLRYIKTTENGMPDGMEPWLTRIAGTESVSVHIRRGDYLLPDEQALFGGICTEAYYREAMRQMCREYPDCRFYLFTNDKEWVREQLARDAGRQSGPEDAGTGLVGRIEVVDPGAVKSADLTEFLLMSRCRHNILANSSFSWWASYLNGNAAKTVIAPDRWLNGWDCEDIYRPKMRRVKGQSAHG